MPHWLPAYLKASHSPASPTLSLVLIENRIKERERRQWLLYYSLPSTPVQQPHPGFKRRPSLLLWLPFSILPPQLPPVSRSSLCPGKTLFCGFFCTCVSDQKKEREGGGEGWCPDPVFGFWTPHCFSSPPPFLHSSPLLLLLTQGRQLNKEVQDGHLSSLPLSLSN